MFRRYGDDKLNTPTTTLLTMNVGGNVMAWPTATASTEAKPWTTQGVRRGPAPAILSVPLMLVRVSLRSGGDSRVVPLTPRDVRRGAPHRPSTPPVP
jgi:hypothetical protein